MKIFYLILITFVLMCIATITMDLIAQAPHGTQSEEVPRGVIDGTNTTFTLNFQPAPWGSIHVFRNGLRMQRNLDYLLGGTNHTQVIFSTPACVSNCVPQAGDTIVVDYTY
jgi:hypothetical protein